MESLKDGKDPAEIDRAKAIAEIAQVIINSAKVEVEYLRVAGGKGSGFIAGNAVETPAGIVGVTRHHLGG